MIQYTVTIDPSINNLGYAIFDTKGKVHTFGLITSSKKFSYPEKALAISQALYRVLTEFHHQISYVVVELPEQWIGNRGTKAVDSEAIQKLYYGTGSIIATLHHLCCQLWYVTPKWKGQVPKLLTVQRAKQWLIKQNININKITDHETDAILLGKFAYEHITISSNAILRFSKPIEEICESQSIAKVEPKVGKVYTVQHIYGCNVLERYRRRPT